MHLTIPRPTLDQISIILSHEDISPPKDTKTPVESPIPVSPSSSVGSSSPVRSTTPPPDYPSIADVNLRRSLDKLHYGSYRDHWEVNQSSRNLMSQILVIMFISGNNH
ncbi:hypothetical protein Tco_0855985 [Tanacetum coccineum]